MNAIETKQRIDFYLDLSRAPRFTFQEYNVAVQDCIYEYISQQVGYSDQRQPQAVQLIQRIRDNLYPLIKTNNPTPSDGTTVVGPYYSSKPTSLPLPTDYDTFLLLQYTISSITYFARPTSYNELGPLLNDSFNHPTNEMAYFNESTSSLTLWRGTSGTVSSALLTYVKTPNTFSIGQDNQIISPSYPYIVPTGSYYALETCVFDSVTYYMGQTITGNNVKTLTSGTIILASNTTPIELPSKGQEIVCKMAAAKMLKTVGMFQESQAIDSEAVKE